jgi:hypothetical protein
MGKNRTISYLLGGMARAFAISVGRRRRYVKPVESRRCSSTICGGRLREICEGPVSQRGVIMKIGGWRTRSVFERYAIVTQSDVADAILKLQNIRNSDTGVTPDAMSELQETPAAVN